MLVGLTLPFYSAYFNKTEFHIIEPFIILISLIGILIGHFADTQLETYMNDNRKLKQNNKQIRPILYSGLWKYSRHPNYFGEQLWWWSFSLFSVTAKDYWMIVGTAFNSFILAIVAYMTE